jgi:(1->4)-alpha-D-glucan 1-alpha-D-glucosylmutase
MSSLLRAEVTRLAAWLRRACPHVVGPESGPRVIRAMAVAMPVYRTYVDVDGRVDGGDASLIERAAATARAALASEDLSALDAFVDVLLARRRGDAEREVWLRFQQLTGPAAAKGVEDTALYRHLRLVSLNDVGSDPGTFGTSLRSFHEENARTLARWPGSLSPWSTHDTKRSQDVRARLHVLAEDAATWRTVVGRWFEQTAGLGGGAPDMAARYLAFQTVVGAWPIGADRLVDFMRKALREAKRRTSWLDPDEEYERGVESWLRALLDDDSVVADVAGYVRRILVAGRVNSLTATLVHLTAPGVPDVYQGSELWDLSLVDPDNRRPVDFGLRERLLRDGRPLDAAGLSDPEAPGREKLETIRRALAVRAELPSAFGAGGGYGPLPVLGERADHAIAFARGGDVAVVAPRFPLGLAGAWGDTTVRLPTGAWIERLTERPVDGSECSIGALLDRFPIALLVRRS